jgi:hypothetical protein
LKISPDVGPTCQQWREGRDTDKTGANMSLCMVGRENEERKSGNPKQEGKTPKSKKFAYLGLNFERLVK